MAAKVLEIDNLQTHFYVREGIQKAVDGVSLTLSEGETLGIVGQSGSGKSVLAKSVMGLVADPGRIIGGSIRFQGRELLGLSEEELTELRGSEMALIVSSPRSRLNPLMSVGQQLANVVMAKEAVSKNAANVRAVELLTSVAMGDPSRVAKMLPSELSGGMCQRVVVAMALAHSPRLILADEPTAGLDVTIQMQVLELMMNLVRNTGSALLLMTRDLGIIAHYCTRVSVLRDGQIIEERPMRDFFKNPEHEHSKTLLEAAFAARGEGEAA